MARTHRHDDHETFADRWGLRILAALGVVTLIVGAYITIRSGWAWGVGTILTFGGALCVWFAYADQPLEEDRASQSRRDRRRP